MRLFQKPPFNAMTTEPVTALSGRNYRIAGKSGAVPCRELRSATFFQYRELHKRFIMFPVVVRIILAFSWGGGTNRVMHSEPPTWDVRKRFFQRVDLAAGHSMHR